MHWQKFILWVFCLAVLGCESELGERYACRYQANMPRECNLETEFDQQPQLSPKMVIYEVDRFNGLEPSSDQELASQELVRRSFEVAKKRGWYDIDQADRDGYRQLFQDRVHFANEAFIMDDYILDPERPEYLMYYDTPQGRQLAGFMFVVRSPGDEGPQIGGALTKWHYHVWSTPFCLKNGMMTVGVPDRNGCSVGQPRQRSPEMIHVWLVDHPLGVFSGQMRVPKELMLELFEKRGL